MPARFHEQEVKSGLKDKRKLSAFLDKLVQTHLEGIGKTSFNYIFCTDDFLLQMNQQYLQHDTLTDIITFDLSDNEQQLTGEIYISVDRVRENAEKYSTSFMDELHRVIFHGALHLCGYKDKKDADKKVMRQKENECLEAYNKELAK
jgi:probable rRNA maturation factor